MEKNREALEVLVEDSHEYHRRCQAITNYATSINGAMRKGKAVLGEFYHDYIEQDSNLHRFCNSPKINLTALTYALQRLPEAVTKVNGVYLLNRADSSERNLQKVTCAARNRTMFDLGKELEIVVREKEADSYDIISCLVMYGIEARKIREKLAGEKMLLEDVASFGEVSDKERIETAARLANTLGVSFAELKKYNSALNHRLFPILDNIVKQLPEEMIIKFDTEFTTSTYPRNAKKWMKTIAEQMIEYKNRPIVIISSDTHGIVNCLTGFAEENQAVIEELASKNKRLSRLEGTDRGLLYYKLQQLCKTEEGKDLLRAKIAHEEKLGIKFIRDRYDTGIDVQIIDTAAIFKVNSFHLDPRLNFDKDYVKSSGPVIVNMDYSFGKQGRYSMQELCETFGKQIKAIALLGKAGILRNDGAKYDLMLPLHVQKQIEGGIYFFPNGNQLRPEDFNRVLSRDFKGKIHADGPMLTVPGTVMQNETVYRHYMRVANIIGAEMEAAHYLDSIVKAYTYKILREDLEMCVGYWASDNPLNPDESLAESHMDYGYIPLYSLISATLNKVLRE